MSTKLNTFPLPSDIYNGYQVFIDELVELEKFYSQKNKDIFSTSSLISSYRGLLERVRAYAKNNHKYVKNGLVHLEKKDVEILSYVHSAILSRINRVNSSESTGLVINMLGYISVIDLDIKELEKQKKLHEINLYKDRYNSRIDAKIAEAKTFIEEIQKTIESYNDELREGLQTLVKEINEAVKKSEDNREKLKNAKEKLKEQLYIKAVFRTIDMGVSLMTFAGPTAQIAGVAIGAVSNITKSALLDDESIPTKISEEGHKLVKEWKKIYKEEKTKKDKELKSRLDAINKQLEELKGTPLDVPKYRKKSDEIRKKIKEAPDPYDLKLNTSKEDEAKLFALEKELREQLKIEKDALEKKKEEGKTKAEKTKLEENHKKVMKAYKWAEGAAKVVECGADLYDLYQKNEEARSTIDKAIGENNKNIEKLRELEESVKKQYIASVKQINSIVSGIYKLDGKSHIEIDVTNWKIKTYLKEINHSFSLYGEEVHGKFAFVFEKISDALETITGIYNRMETYQEQAQMINYIANVNKSGVAVDHDEVNLLKKIILKNIIMERYGKLMNTVKLWAFPFAQNFFNNFKTLMDTEDEIDIQKVIENIKKLEIQIKSYNSTITDLDFAITTAQFGTLNSEIPPFFIWKNDLYKEKINNLFLKGEKMKSKITILNASIEKTKHHLSRRMAIKFNHIELCFKHKNVAKQKQLEKCLEKFDIHMIVATKSSYIFFDKLYQFDGNLNSKGTKEALKLSYCLKRDASGQHKNKSDSYKKLAKGEIVLSPYTTWQIYLKEVNQGEGDFKKLEEFKDCVDISLIGRGTYINGDEIDLKKLELSKYYPQKGINFSLSSE